MEMLYHSVSDLVRLANEHQIPLWKVVLLADVQERQVTVEESFETMRQMYQAMRQADQEYDGSIVSASGMAGGDGEKLHAYNASGRSLAGGYMGLVMEKAGKMKKIPNRCYTKWFDYDKIRHGVVIRTRRPGDCLANGEHAHKKLKDYLIDSKVPREKRDGLILLADGNQVVWIVGMRISEDYKVTEQTKTILKVQIKNREE